MSQATDMRKIVWVLAFVLAAGAVMAAPCPDIQSTDTQALLAEIPSINTQLQQCPLPLPRGAGLLLGNPTRLDIGMNDGSTESLMLTVRGGQITNVARGGGVCSKRISTTEKVLDTVLGSQNRGAAALFVLARGGLAIKGCTVWTRFTSFFANPVGKFVAKRTAPPQLPPQVPQQQWGKPDNCEDTWLPGHRGYAENKQLWDSYSSDTDGVCQSIYGRGMPSPCVHGVQLSVQGNPYYLCWYRN